MDRLVWWDEETEAAAVHCMQCTLAARSRYRYAVKQYIYKIGKITYLKRFTCIIEMMYCIHSWRHNISSV
jgi:hypothetical protein